jgi:hypothetical protein
MIVIETEVPPKMSMRLSSTKSFGGDIHDLWDISRFDSRSRSRNAATQCKKDFRANSSRNYRPWQRDSVKSIKELTELTE